MRGGDVVALRGCRVMERLACYVQVSVRTVVSCSELVVLAVQHCARCYVIEWERAAGEDLFPAVKPVLEAAEREQ